MAGNKTKPTDASVQDYIAGRGSAQQRADCQELMALLEEVTRQPPRMWGPSIVGFGAYRYTYESGRTGEAPLTGFAIRGRELVIYVDAERDAQKSLLSRLGPHRAGKACVYVKRLADLDRPVLHALVAGSVAELRRRYGRRDRQSSPADDPRDRMAAVPTGPASRHRIFTTAFASVYPHYVRKAEARGRTRQEVDQVIRWLTGYGPEALAERIERRTDFEAFFGEAPALHPNAGRITGVICGVRVEEIADPLMRNIRCLDKLVDELAKGRPMERILRD